MPSLAMLVFFCSPPQTRLGGRLPHATTLPSTICEVSKMRMASRAALIPLAIIAPNVGPIRFEPSCSLSSIPAPHKRQHKSASQPTNVRPFQRGERTRHDEPGRDLARAVDDRGLGAVHVEPAHVPELLEEAHADQPLRAERAHGPVVARRAHDDRRGDHVRVHARLRVVVERDERPVRHDARDALRGGLGRGERVGRDDEVLDRGRVEEDDVGEREHARERRLEGRDVLVSEGSVRAVRRDLAHEDLADGREQDLCAPCQNAA